jgi:hypothetical protein
MGALTAGVALAAQELRDLRLEGGLDEERDPEPGYFLQDVAKLPAGAEQRIRSERGRAQWGILVVTRASGTS